MNFNPFEAVEMNEREAARIACTVLLVIALLGLVGLLLVDHRHVYLLPDPPPEAFYAKPSQYEREHGPPDQVCKVWGGEFYEPAERKECVRRTTGDDE